MSGVDVNGDHAAQGRGDAVGAWVRSEGGHAPAELDGVGRPHRPRGRHAARGRRDSQVLGVIHLKDTVKEGMAARFERLRRDGHPHGDGDRRQPPHRREDRVVET